MISIEGQVEILRRGVIDLVSEKELFEKLKNAVTQKKPLRVKLGVDPTSPDIHLGHTVVLHKLKQFQDFGHQAVLIIGDYTALVGDPSGAQKTRPQLTLAEIKKNAKTYFDQVQKILNLKRLEIRYNGEWFKKMPFKEVIALSARMTVARMLERDDFSKRFKNQIPICIHEFMYPLMQGYDSLMVKADVELGGTDQLFNLLVGRAFQKEEGLEPQVIVTTPLLEGTDGVLKMSKSLHNTIGVTDSPQEIYGKVMSISDELMWRYYELLSELPLDPLKEQKQRVEEGKINPKELKMKLAFELVSRFYSKADAAKAAAEFERIFQDKKMPTDIEEVVIEPGGQIFLSKLIVLAQCAASHSEARRLMEQGAVSVDGKRYTDIQTKLDARGEIMLKVGKRRFRKIKFKSVGV